MHVITRKRLNEFVERYPETQNAIVKWYQLVKQNTVEPFIELWETFPSADQVAKRTIFNIGGNKI